MKKFLVSLSCFLMLMFAFNMNVMGEPVKSGGDIVKVNFKSALLMEDSSGKIIYEHNSHEKLSPASVTKIMTLLLAFEDVQKGKIKLSDKVTITARAKSIGGTTMCLQTGEVRTLEELIKGVVIQSANDGAVAIAEFLGGTEELFIQRMNKRASELGMKDTHFVNPMGFYDKDHYTSAYDIALMSHELLKHKQILKYTTIWTEVISEGRAAPIMLANTNKLIRAFKGCDGLKTGYVPESKYCISATASRDGIRFVSVIMGAPTSKERNASASQLLNYGFAKYSGKKVISKGEKLAELEMPKSKPAKANVVANEDLSIITEKGQNIDMKKEVVLDNNLKLPIKMGDKIGVCRVTDNGKVLGEVPVVTDVDLNSVSLVDTIGKTLKLWIKFK